MLLKKIDRNCFLCYKKSFLSYSIFNLRKTDNSPLPFASKGNSLSSLLQGTTLCQAFFTAFLKFVEIFSQIFIPCAFLRTACLFYHREKIKSTDFYNIF